MAFAHPIFWRGWAWVALPGFVALPMVYYGLWFVADLERNLFYRGAMTEHQVQEAARESGADPATAHYVRSIAYIFDPWPHLDTAGYDGSDACVPDWFDMTPIYDLRQLTAAASGDGAAVSAL